jgi:hypothetical protein
MYYNQVVVPGKTFHYAACLDYTSLCQSFALYFAGDLEN